MEQPYFGVGAIVFSIVSGYFYLHMLNRTPVSDVQKEEMEKIEDGYRERFSETGKVGEATLSAKKEELRDFHSKSEVLAGDIESLERQLNALEVDINHLLGKFTKIKDKKGDWAKMVNQLQMERQAFDGERQNKSLELSRLDIPENKYREKSTEVSYDPDVHQDLSRDLEETQAEKKQLEDDLDNLKYAVRVLIGENDECEWEQMIEKLHQKRADTVKQYKEITARLIASITVNQALDELREYEAARIDDGLRSEEVQKALLDTTGHYKQIEKEGGELILSDDFGRYHLNTLSTGAREQVLLGLRLGFAAKLLAGKQLFLILDDAFQHSDYPRRKRLVKKLFELAEEGWQVLYFTMDDHIRGLFEQSGKKMGKENYQIIEVQGM